MSLIKEIHSYLSSDIKSINNLIIDSLAVDETLIQLIGTYLSESGGKRIRPVLTMLSSRMLGYQGDNAIKLAAAIEFLHMATLLHDDVVDESEMRRFKPSANVVWGNNASILVGDFLFSQAFRLMVSTNLVHALEVLSNASSIIIKGEVSQLMQLEDKNFISEQEYLKIINAKTAELFGTACEIGGILAEKEGEAKILKNFGFCLGNIFQIADDVLDYFSNSEKVGKNIGDDFYEGKVTLPLILLSKKISKQDDEKLKQMLLLPRKERKESDLNWIVDLMKHHDIQKEILIYLDELKQEAISLIGQVRVENQYKQYLQDLVDFAITRTH
ncbi:polyprenyl synthetase family protein [Rickettsiaceae bacterium]|nr:polyprenyl synthetase family protein [Rickettsiaceae bacterium]